MSSDPASYFVEPDPRSYHASYESYGGFRREGTEHNLRSVFGSSFRIASPTPPSDAPSPSAMPLNNTWIEKGPDGRPFFVRKKTKLPSTRQLLSDAFAPLRKPSLPFSRSYQRDHYIFPVPMSTPLYLSAPPIPPAATSNPHLPQHPPAPTNSPTSANMNPYYPQSQQQNGKNSENNPRGILKPAPQSYPAPSPGMYPAPPPQVPHGQFPSQVNVNPHLGPPYSPQQFPSQHLPFPTQPPGISQATPLPPGARVISPPRLPSADDLKYKCSVCGRFRSARYHYKHPIPPGHYPGRTICRNCREEATDSEDEAESSESLDDRRHRRRRSRSQRRAMSADVAVSRTRSRSWRGRSPSRVIYSDEEDYDYYRRPVRGRSWSRSSSLEVEPIRRATRRARSRHGRSPSVDVVRYVERAERPKLTRRITYIDELPRRTYDYDDMDDSGGYSEEY